ncbi:hypothetical protein [Chitinophaga flava]|uniref:Uncharacterized protein n=1 Tax=Chitinophaga flava TaxID=2259036 RepID=A0A365Y3L5_9BACT|nr:hypothetical protein [Chitinophaga flava]RBL92485.1 hypothetical protein DF182_07850 [Chitinophaga flava]
MMKFKLSRFTMEISIPAFEQDHAADKLLYSTRTGKTIRISRPYLDIIHTGELQDLPMPLFRTLIQHEMLVPSDEYETDTIITRNLSIAADHAINTTTLLLPFHPEPDNIFITQLHQGIASACRQLPAAGVKDVKHTIRLLLVLQEHNIDLSWLHHLDQHLLQLSNTYRVDFAFQLLYLHPEDAFVAPSLKHTIQNNIHLVIGNLWQPKRIDNTVIMLLHLSKQLESIPHLQLSITLLITGNCWTNWDTQMINILQRLSALPQATLFCYPDLSEADELAFMKFMSAQNIRCEWLPPATFSVRPDMQVSLQQLLENSLQPGTIQILKVPAVLEQEELYRLHQYPSTRMFAQYYTDTFVQHLFATGCPCRYCQQLPLCGGNTLKTDDSNDDCPVFSRNLPNRVLLSAGLLPKL